MTAGEPVKWKSHFNQLIARPIPQSEFPKIAKKMIEDGLIAILTTEGIVWYAGRYRVQRKVVAEMWNLTTHQIKRFERWVYRDDPFIEMVEEIE